MGGTVLLIDDERDMGDLVGQWLAEVDTSVVWASGFEDAVAAAGRERPRAVLLDISLGGEDGLSILRRLMAAPGLVSVPVVVFSVHDSRRWEAFDLGAKGFVKKPFEGADLLAALHPYL
jgi:DNA-binding response OmpR family regulator